MFLTCQSLGEFLVLLFFFLSAFCLLVLFTPFYLDQTFPKYFPNLSARLSLYARMAISTSYPRHLVQFLLYIFFIKKIKILIRIHLFFCICLSAQLSTWLSTQLSAWLSTGLSAELAVLVIGSVIQLVICPIILWGDRPPWRLVLESGPPMAKKCPPSES